MSLYMQLEAQHYKAAYVHTYVSMAQVSAHPDSTTHHLTSD